MSGKWIKIKGEDKTHKCNLPWSLDTEGMSGTHLQKRHEGSVWKCECKLEYRFNGKKFKLVR